jgi:hypothetical protein
MYDFLRTSTIPPQHLSVAGSSQQPAAARHHFWHDGGTAEQNAAGIGTIAAECYRVFAGIISCSPPQPIARAPTTFVTGGEHITKRNYPTD